MKHAGALERYEVGGAILDADCGPRMAAQIGEALVLLAGSAEVTVRPAGATTGVVRRRPRNSGR